MKCAIGKLDMGQRRSEQKYFQKGKGERPWQPAVRVNQTEVKAERCPGMSKKQALGPGKMEKTLIE